MNIQSLAQPNVYATFELVGEQFLKFCDFYSLNDIGFKDKRTGAKKVGPFEESATRVCFLTRAKGKCKEKCELGDLMLNVI